MKIIYNIPPEKYNPELKFKTIGRLVLLTVDHVA